MELFVELFAAYGLLLVFAAALLDQGGLPVPAYPAIVVASALAFDAGASVWPILAVATLATLLADLAWFLGGRRIGAKLLRLMCRLSLSPDSCVAQTRDVYGRWGAPSLIVAKFIPGFAAVATTLAGETRTGLPRFLFFDGLGAALWAGGAVALGVFFHAAVNDVLLALESLGHVALPALALALAGFVGVKWLQRHRFERQVRMQRVSVAQLRDLLAAEPAPLVLDVRSQRQRDADGWIPDSRRLERAEAVEADFDVPIVVYCDCPNEASAALAAKALRARGFRNVLPLAGGLAAWREAGHPVQGLQRAA